MAFWPTVDQRQPHVLQQEAMAKVQTSLYSHVVYVVPEPSLGFIDFTYSCQMITNTTNV